MLLTEYKKAYGADILDLLGALFVDCEEAPGFRFRYWRLMNVSIPKTSWAAFTAGACHTTAI